MQERTEDMREKKHNSRRISAVRILAAAAAAACLLLAGPGTMEARAWAYTEKVTAEELMLPALKKSGSAELIYRQLKLALQYKQLDEGGINRLCLNAATRVSGEVMTKLYQEGYLSAYSWKYWTGGTPTPADMYPVFNAAAYLNYNADLQEAVGTDPNALLAHYLACGMAEGRKASDAFDVQVYRQKNPDLQAAYGNDLAGYVRHYMLFGRFEGRTVR